MVLALAEMDGLRVTNAGVKVLKFLKKKMQEPMEND